MMNRPMYNRTHWNMSPSQPPRYKAPSKIVTIPVHFIRSESRRIDSAIKIQKLVRGFLVRNIMRRISQLRVEVEQIEHKVSVPEIVEIIKRDDKEKLRVSETIMNLLLRLDSVRVLNFSGVRECRKSVIKRAIALQELIDQIEGINDQHQDQPQKSTQVDDVDTDAEFGSVGVDSLGEGVGTGLVEENCLVEEEGLKGASELLGNDSQGEKLEALGNEEKKMEVEEMKEEGVGEGEHVGEESLVEEVEENCLVKEEKGGIGDEEEGCKGEKLEDLGNEEEEEKMEIEEKEEEVGESESVGTSLVEEVEENCLVKEEEGHVESEEEEEEDCKGGRGRGRGKDGEDDGRKNRELLERMMEDNERMMGLMTQLFEKNEMQTRLLSTLSQRVEHLERAFAFEKLRRKKRRHVDAKHKENENKK